MVSEVEKFMQVMKFQRQKYILEVILWNDEVQKNIWRIKPQSIFCSHSNKLVFCFGILSKQIKKLHAFFHSGSFFDRNHRKFSMKYSCNFNGMFCTFLISNISCLGVNFSTERIKTKRLSRARQNILLDEKKIWVSILLPVDSELAFCWVRLLYTCLNLIQFTILC